MKFVLDVKELLKSRYDLEYCHKNKTYAHPVFVDLENLFFYVDIKIYFQKQILVLILILVNIRKLLLLEKLKI